MKGRLTVLYPITDLARDGTQRQLFELVRGLDRGRFRPIVLTLHEGGAMAPDFQRIPDLEMLSVAQKGKFDAFCLYRVGRVLRKMEVEIVQPFLTPATFFALFPALLLRTPVKVVTERCGPGRTATGLGYRFYLKTEDTLTRFADWAVANSEAGRRFLLNRGIRPERVRVVYNGLDLSRFNVSAEQVTSIRRTLGVAPGNKVVGISARLFTQKRHDLFIRTAAIIDRELPGTKFAVVGDGPLRSQTEALSHELGLDGKVVFLGEQREVAPFVAAMDVSVLTSETEGCSNSVLEAMALRKPVVATDVGGNRELIRNGETGILVPFGKTEKLARAVIDLLREPSVASSIGQNARRTIETRFSIQAMVSQYESLYQEAMASRLKGRAGERLPRTTPA